MKLDQQISEFVSATKRNNEIRLKDFFEVFSKGKRIIWFSILIFFVIGLIYSVTSPNEYTTTSQILTEQPRLPGGKSQLGALANLAGLGGGAASEEVISPDLYPAVLTNSNFLLELATEEYYFEQHQKYLTLTAYFSKYEKRNWISLAVNYPIGRIKSLFRRKSTSTNPKSAVGVQTSDSTESVSYKELTPAEIAAIDKLKSRIIIEKLDRIISVSTKIPDPRVSAILNRKLIDYLIEYVTAIQTDRENQNATFIEQQLEQAKERVEKAQAKLATFKDLNRGLILEVDKARGQRLQTEFNLASSIYNTIAQQHEQAKIKLQESKPVLTVLQDPILPLQPSEPNVLTALIVFSILGLFVGIMIIGFKIIREFFRRA